MQLCGKAQAWLVMSQQKELCSNGKLITEIGGGVLFYKAALEKRKVSIKHKQQDV